MLIYVSHLEKWRDYRARRLATKIPGSSAEFLFALHPPIGVPTGLSTTKHLSEVKSDLRLANLYRPPSGEGNEVGGDRNVLHG